MFGHYADHQSVLLTIEQIRNIATNALHGHTDVTHVDKHLCTSRGIHNECNALTYFGGLTATRS